MDESYTNIPFYKEGLLMQGMAVVALLACVVLSFAYGRYLKYQLYSIRRSRYKVVERGFSNVSVGVLSLLLMSQFGMILFDLNFFVFFIPFTTIFIASFLLAGRIKAS